MDRAQLALHSYVNIPTNGLYGKDSESPNTKSRRHKSTATCAVNLSTNAGRSTTNNQTGAATRQAKRPYISSCNLTCCEQVLQMKSGANLRLGSC
jgi:hypothetical protein